MPLVLGSKDTIKKKVKIVEIVDMNREKRSDIVVEFRRRKRSDVDRIMEALRTGDTDDIDVLSEDVVNISGLLTEAGEEVPYSKDLLPDLLEETHVAMALTESWLEVQRNRKEVRQKNS